MNKWKSHKESQKWQLFLYLLVRTPLTEILLAGSDDSQVTKKSYGEFRTVDFNYYPFIKQTHEKIMWLLYIKM